MVSPPESALFRDRKKGSQEINNFKETYLYENDTLGLKTLYEAYKVKFYTVAHGHLHFAEDLIVNQVIPGLFEKNYVMH